MNTIKQKRKIAMASLFAFSIGGVALNANAAPDWSNGLTEIEKCAGVAKKGKNDCGTKSHDCGGKAKKDNMVDEWVYTPVGLCEKIGGKTLMVKKLKG